MKRIITVIISIAIFILTVCPVSAAEPRYTNAHDITFTLSITNSGLAEIFVQVDGKTQLIQSYVTVYLERKVGSSWSRVNIGTESNVWTISTTNREFSQVFYAQLGRTGTYRAVAIFNFEGETIETITKTETYTY